MSFNIERIDAIGGAALILTHVELHSFRKLRNLPEFHPFEPDNWEQLGHLPNFERMLKLTWCGQGSGSSFDTLKEFLRATLGMADFVVVWEDATVSGLRANNGIVTEHKAIIKLGEELK